MENPRKYGCPPFKIVVIHGGPGAAGEMAPVARELSGRTGVLEPLQTAVSLEGQVAELALILTQYGQPPTTLIGFSWGAWLSYLVAAFHPLLVGKLILVGCPPLEEQYAGKIMPTRLERLDGENRDEALLLLGKMESGVMAEDKLARFGGLMELADAYDPLPRPDETFLPDPAIFGPVWRDAARLRGSGELLRLGKKIRCPVVAIHGDYDPHPADGVRLPLSRVLRDFRLFLLPKCGHRPWLERQAHKSFYTILREETA